jgi:hypothetical protein
MTSKVSKYSSLVTLFTALAAFAIAQPSMSAEPLPKWDGDGVIEEGEDETAELAQAAQNPVANMYSLSFQNNSIF